GIAGSGGRAHFEACDVAQADDWERVAASARERFGGVDVVVNNAYANVVRSTLDLDPADWHRMLDVNLGQVYHSVRTCMP
ncbi:SDR family NAD(P)-dependent oxidoreductase, partial [Enterococcus casseliflavus]|uniref:SDR family NAD(P)-dependent oxidoreductase n=1 Tax=Enterococcus casseliflavus TaxID=37734 RepID=UPI003D0EBD16